jgi:hypothetical protein
LLFFRVCTLEATTLFLSGYPDAMEAYTDPLDRWYVVVLPISPDIHLTRDPRDCLMNEQTGTRRPAYTECAELTWEAELFRQIKAENEELRTKQKMYETDLKVWRGAMDAAGEKAAAMERLVMDLQREVSFVKVRAREHISLYLIYRLVQDQPLILCLIDGDGNIFTQELIKNGRQGGHQAASLLSKGIHEYLALAQSTAAGRGQLWVTVYMNQRGLSETLAANNLCTLDEFDEFVIGFNQSSPLFSIVDVGNGKEAADAKIKGMNGHTLCCVYEHLQYCRDTSSLHSVSSNR